MYKFYIQLDNATNGNYEKFLEKLATFESSNEGYHCVNAWNYLGRYQIGEDTICSTGYYTNSKIEKYKKDGLMAFKWNGKWENPKNLKFKNIYDFLGLNDSCKKDTSNCNPYPYKNVVNNKGKKKLIFDESEIDKKKLKNCIAGQEDIIRIIHQKKWWAVWSLLTSEKERTDFNGKTDDKRKQIMIDKMNIGKEFDYEGKSYKITTSGIIAGAHLKGEGNIVKFLKNGTITKDALGTEITKYMALLSGYDMMNLFNYTRINDRPNYTPLGEGLTDSKAKEEPKIQTKNLKITSEGFSPEKTGIRLPPYEGNTAKLIKEEIKTDKLSTINPEGKVICNGATLKCTQGDATSIYNVLPAKQVFINNQPIALISDTKPMVNIMPCGQCKSMTNPTVAAATAANKGQLKKMPCVPNTIGTWSDGLSYFLVGKAVVSDKSTCKCAYAGTISIEKGKEGQSFLGYKKAGGSSKNHKKNDEKKKTKDIKEAKPTKLAVNNAVNKTVNKTTEGNKSNSSKGFIQLPNKGAGYNRYMIDPNGDDNWGKPEFVNILKEIAEKWYEKDKKNLISFGDLSRKNGGELKPHKSHKNGDDADLCLLYNGIRIENMDLKSYDKKKCQEFVSLLKTDFPSIKEILFGDKTITGVKVVSGHRNHMHIGL